MALIGGLSDLYLSELRNEAESTFSDTADVYTKSYVATATVSDGRGGVSKTGRVNNEELRLTGVACRLQSVRMKISMGEAEVSGKSRSQDEQILVFPYNTVINNNDRVFVTTRDGFTGSFEITQQMEQTDAITRVFAVVRVS